MNNMKVIPGQLWTWEAECSHTKPTATYYLCIHSVSRGSKVKKTGDFIGQAVIKHKDGSLFIDTSDVYYYKDFFVFPLPTLVTDQKIITQIKMLLL